MSGITTSSREPSRTTSDPLTAPQVVEALLSLCAGTDDAALVEAVRAFVGDEVGWTAAVS